MQDAEGLDETAKFYGVSPVCVEGVAHDMMLDCSWERGAEVILSWIRRCIDIKEESHINKKSLST